MYFLIKTHWDNLNKKIWGSLEESVAAPYDMYIELLRYLNDKQRYDASWEELNNPDVARKKFNQFPNPNNEVTCISILEAYYDILSQFNVQIAQKYQAKLLQYITEYNLRYKLTPKCQFKLSLQGLLVTQYAYLLNIIREKADRLECLNELEAALAKLGEEYEDNNCIRVASNLLEGLLNDRANTTGLGLTAALNRCRDLFPYLSLKECIEKVYEFCCDYPNLRHAGRSNKRMRALKKDDAILIIALTIGLGSFIANNDASENILNGNLQ